MRISAVRRSSSTAPRTGVPDRRQRVAFGRDQVEVVAFPDVGDAGLDPAPQQNAVVGRLAAAARIEGRLVQHDAVGPGRQHDRVPVAQGLVVEFEPVRPPGVLAHDGSLLPVPRPPSRMLYQGP